jgi:hypothetical protein
MSDDMRNAVMSTQLVKHRRARANLSMPHRPRYLSTRLHKSSSPCNLHRSTKFREQRLV